MCDLRKVREVLAACGVCSVRVPALRWETMDVEFERRLLRPTNGPRSLLASPGSPQRPPGATAAALAAAHSHRSPISVKLYYKGYFRVCLTLIDFFVFQSPARRSLFREPGCSLSPLASPAKRERFGDRFIPTRSGNNWETNFSMISVSIIE